MPSRNISVVQFLVGLTFPFLLLLNESSIGAHMYFIILMALLSLMRGFNFDFVLGILAVFAVGYLIFSIFAERIKYDLLISTLCVLILTCFASFSFFPVVHVHPNFSIALYSVFFLLALLYFILNMVSKAREKIDT